MSNFKQSLNLQNRERGWDQNQQHRDRKPPPPSPPLLQRPNRRRKKLFYYFSFHKLIRDRFFNCRFFVGWHVGNRRWRWRWKGWYFSPSTWACMLSNVQRASTSRWQWRIWSYIISSFVKITARLDWYWYREWNWQQHRDWNQQHYDSLSSKFPD